MKILSIRGKNLASIEGEFAIDFQSEPLRSAGIFAITGNTGSGKTTLLDAMCIALYYKSPRTYKAKTERSFEREDDDIKENDCRNILRRGTGEGYAEVEFLALNGKKYLSRWSVNRARNKADGNLQPAKCELTCITDNQFISNRKSENEKNIEKLIGLNYEQFTRAVLLAQGEFSAFLKASPNEKADILEKLTGTEIYARISERIFDKSKEADAAHKIIEEKLKGIILLTPEECTKLETEKNDLQKRADKEEEELSTINEKLKWIERSLNLEKEKENAIKKFEECKAALDAMSDIISILEKIDLIQPIRDIYIEKKRINKRIEEEEREIKALNLQLQQQEEQYNASETELQECKNKKEIIEQQKAEKEPLILEATKIESERNNTLLRMQKNNQQLTQTKERLTQLNREQSNSITKITNNQEEQKQIEIWFTTHKIYSSIITRNEAISTNIADAQDAKLQIVHKSTMLKKSEEQQRLFENNLSEAKKETERLKATLTLEIATLRRQLVEGEPCPVCGSIHHFTAHVTENILNEEELKKAQKQNEDNIKRLSENIEKTKTEIATLASSIAEYKKIYTSRVENLLTILAPLPQIGKIKESNNIISELQQIANIVAQTATQWEAKSKRSIKLEQETLVEQTTLRNIEKQIKELETNIPTYEEAIATAKDDVEEYNKKISEILGDAKSISEITEYFRNEIEKYGKEFSQCTLRRNDLLVALTKTRQSIDTINKSIEERKTNRTELNSKIDEFLAKNKDKTDSTLLEELTQISSEECINMRRRITTAKENLLQANTQLSERIRNIEQHQLAAIKPCDEDSKESLTIMQQELKEQTQQRLEKITQIIIRLNSDKENKERTKQLRKEEKDANNYSTNWKRLNEIFGSAKGDKFRMIAQGYTLDIMLSYANMHLKQLSSRYQLERTAPDTLALTIIDLDMLSERRPVNTLSGGETFLVSLALALALSSLSSSNMSIESLFIDEGFGSLDSDTLRIAMEALEHLHSLGRKIGVISHLSSILERIPTQICITKRQGGRSCVEIKQQY